MILNLFETVFNYFEAKLISNWDVYEILEVT